MLDTSSSCQPLPRHYSTHLPETSAGPICFELINSPERGVMQDEAFHHARNIPWHHDFSKLASSKILIEMQVRVHLGRKSSRAPYST